ncbi:MAG: 3-hydroxyacyl-[acyl-carrier-protein] dehydratase FabZ [Nitrospinota bacterium]|nr:MAG: 3-hydroxyacyl-[acyl-carrier-protein] dehydratase FabZ [Nitrospinota bacterium]
MDVREIQEYLPHRYPFLLVDRIVEIEKEKRIVGIKNVSLNEPHFTGHFPGYPIMPGVLLIEAMAQVGGVLVFYTLGRKGKNIALFTGIDKARFRAPVLPGDQVRLELTVLKRRGDRIWRFKGKAFVQDKLVAESELQAIISEEAP